MAMMKKFTRGCELSMVNNHKEVDSTMLEKTHRQRKQSRQVFET